MDFPQVCAADQTQETTRTSPWGFPVLYLGWAYLFWAPILGSESSVWSGTNLVLFLVGGASPLLAGLTMAWLTGGRDQVRDLGRRLVDVRRIAGRWWLFVLGYWLLFDLVMAAVAFALGVSDRPLDVAWELAREPGRLGFLLLLSFVFPAVEEIGLRGYWLDRLQERFTPAIAGLINGATWAVWHTPFVLFPGYYANTTFNPQLTWWLPMIVCDTLLFVWVYNRTGRSILAVLLLHGMMNFTGEVLGISADMYPFVLSGYVLVAIAVVVALHRQAPERRAQPRIGAAILRGAADGVEEGASDGKFARVDPHVEPEAVRRVGIPDAGVGVSEAE